MELGSFSVSLAVKDIEASRRFLETAPVIDDEAQRAEERWSAE